jgi:hypothetical protein
MAPRERALTMFLEQPSPTTHPHLQKVLERGLSLDQVEALLFFKVVEYLARLCDGLATRFHQHRAELSRRFEN